MHIRRNGAWQWNPGNGESDNFTIHTSLGGWVYGRPVSRSCRGGVVVELLQPGEVGGVLFVADRCQARQGVRVRSTSASVTT